MAEASVPVSAVHVARGTSYIIIQTVVANAAQIVSFALLARLITPIEMGILAVLTLVGGTCIVTGTLSLQQAAVRFVAENLRSIRTTAASVFYQAIRTTLFLAVVLGAAIFFGARLLATNLLGSETYTIYFQLQAFDVVLTTGLIPVLSGTMLGLQKFKQAAGIGTLGTVVRQSLIILLVLLMQSFLGLVVAWIISDLALASMYTIYLIKRLGPPRLDFPLGRLLRYSWPLALGNGISYLYGTFDYAVLLILAPLTTLGIYNVTIQAFGVLTAISTAITTTLFSAYSAIRLADLRRNSSDVIRLASRYGSLIIVPLALGLLSTARPALTLLVGRAYLAGAEPLMVLSGMLALTTIGVVLYPVLLALAETRSASAITGASVVMSLSTAILLVPPSGILGASLARGIGMIVSTILTFLMLRRKMQLRLDIRMMSATFAAGLIMAGIVVAIQALIYSALLLPMYVIIGAVVYLVGLRVMRALKQEDLELFGEYLGPRLRFVKTILSWVLLPAHRQ